MSHRTELGAALYACRRARRLTQEQVGSRVGRSQSWVSLVENEWTRPTRSEARQLEEALELRPDTLTAFLPDADTGVDSVWQELAWRDPEAAAQLRGLAVNLLVSTGLNR